eukprot:3308553-Rhodomonas_salina.1
MRASAAGGESACPARGDSGGHSELQPEVAVEQPLSLRVGLCLVARGGLPCTSRIRVSPATQPEPE